MCNLSASTNTSTYTISSKSSIHASWFFITLGHSNVATIRIAAASAAGMQTEKRKASILQYVGRNEILSISSKQSYSFYCDISNSLRAEVTATKSTACHMVVVCEPRKCYDENESHLLKTIIAKTKIIRIIKNIVGETTRQ